MPVILEPLCPTRRPVGGSCRPAARRDDHHGV